MLVEGIVFWSKVVNQVQGVQLRKRDSQRLTEAPHKKHLDIYVVIIAEQDKASG